MNDECGNLPDIIEDICKELARSRELHGDMKNGHEGYAILKEEIDELWSEVKCKDADPDVMVPECIQIAAMAIKFIQDVCMMPGDRYGIVFRVGDAPPVDAGASDECKRKAFLQRCGGPMEKEWRQAVKDVAAFEDSIKRDTALLRIRKPPADKSAAGLTDQELRKWAVEQIGARAGRPDELFAEIQNLVTFVQTGGVPKSQDSVSA